MRKKEKLGKKFYMIAILCTLVISSVIGISVYKTAKSITGNEKTEDENNTNDKRIKEEVALETEDIELENVAGIFIFEITNRGEHIEPILKQWSYLVNQGLAQYVQDNQIKATGAISFEVEMLHGETQFFFECNDEEKTTLVLTYRQHDRNVEVETTDYTQEDMREKARLVGGDTLLEAEEDSATE
jgi:hypothetical protein